MKCDICPKSSHGGSASFICMLRKCSISRRSSASVIESRLLAPSLPPSYGSVLCFRFCHPASVSSRPFSSRVAPVLSCTFPLIEGELYLNPHSRLHKGQF